MGLIPKTLRLQHHRPATSLPVDVKIESHPGGAKTVWCGDHDPMCRMKGM
jgi:hypothetical protein